MHVKFAFNAELPAKIAPNRLSGGILDRKGPF
jgi:hypothetical protein